MMLGGVRKEFRGKGLDVLDGRQNPAVGYQA